MQKDQRISPLFEAFLKEIEGVEASEIKIEKALNFMEKAISQEQGADFRGFWDVRMKCLELFKENVSPFVRGALWNRLSELSKEARKLKEMLDEQSDFAAEQIDIAVQAIEKGLDELGNAIMQGPDFQIPPYAYALKENRNLYKQWQTELEHLNLYAAKITSLRKELIKTDMRVKVKNKFFERMSKAGDRVFPRRKNLIQDISRIFSEDIERFIQTHFENPTRLSIFDLREEIKALQSCAKQFTLNTQSFGKTRLQLSECWDQLKEKEKERKEEIKKEEEVKKAQDEEKQKQEENRLRQKRELFDSFQGRLNNLLDRASSLESEALIAERDQLAAELQKSALSKAEKIELEKSLKTIKDVLRQKREEALLALPADEQLALEQLKALLLEKQAYRQEIKERMQHYRKLMGSSNLSLEKSMEYSARAREEKEDYEKAGAALEEIEQKIENLEIRLS